MGGGYAVSWSPETPWRLGKHRINQRRINGRQCPSFLHGRNGLRTHPIPEQHIGNFVWSIKKWLH